MDVYIVEDNDIQLNFTITDQNGTAVNLGGATVKLYYKVEGSSTSSNKTCTVDVAASGTCHASLAPADLATGDKRYEAELKVTTSGGKVYTAYDKFYFYVRKKVE